MESFRSQVPVLKSQPGEPQILLQGSHWGGADGWMSECCLMLSPNIGSNVQGHVFEAGRVRAESTPEDVHSHSHSARSQLIW